MGKKETEKESPKERITRHWLEKAGHAKVNNFEIPWRDFCELSGIPLVAFGSEEYSAHMQRRNRYKDSLNRYWRRNKKALVLTPGKPGQSIILHIGDDAAHAEIVRSISKETVDVSRASIRFDEMSKAGGLSLPASESLSKTRRVFFQARMLLAKSVNNLGLPEPKRKQLMNLLIPPCKWPWEKKDDYESTFRFE